MITNLFSEDYLNFIKWAKKNNIEVKPLTNSQHKFFELLLANQDNIPQIGDLHTILTYYKKYIKRDREREENDEDKKR